VIKRAEINPTTGLWTDPATNFTYVGPQGPALTSIAPLNEAISILAAWETFLAMDIPGLRRMSLLPFAGLTKELRRAQVLEGKKWDENVKLTCQVAPYVAWLLKRAFDSSPTLPRGEMRTIRGAA